MEEPVVCHWLYGFCCDRLLDTGRSVCRPGEEGVIRLVGHSFFGGGGLFLFLVTLYSKIFRIPLLRIYDDRLEHYLLLKGVYHTLHFADLRRFRMIKSRGVKMVAIDYKTAPMIDKMEHSSRWMQALMIFSFHQNGAIAFITVQNLDTNGK